ncbi:hypothetical protein SLS60_000403 [Paraconiothyrium brasiliense]|uniref:Aminoglycoside phosphotransferase domain-containing protein n=1 Tax=Paraconiothyrium brasiliense TaxID=300254 RepID=A0ABR3S7B0_9PLEO
MSASSEREDWLHIRAIPDWKYKEILVDVVQSRPPAPRITTDQCTVFARREGAYHHVVCISLLRQHQTERYAIRVPAHGTAEYWGEEDRYMLRREAELLRQIRHNTTIPAPNVIAFYTELDDTLGAPYMIQEVLPGNNAYSIWFDQPYDEATAYLSADKPTPQTQRKRLNMLKSLAGYMTQLAYLEYPLIGMPNIPFRYDIRDASACEDSNSVIGPTYHWNSSTDPHAVVKRGPFPSTQAYIKASFDDLFDIGKLCKDRDPETDVQLQMQLGARKVLEIIFSTTPFNVEEESFVIHHHDLDLQNILTDEDGYVTGIIDWDGAFAGPRCIGPAAAPKFLVRDWYPDEHGEFLEESPHMAWNTQYYRDVYAGAVREAELQQGTFNDAKYTSKSAIYRQAFAALYGGGLPMDFTDKVLRQIGICQHPHDFKVMLGRGGFISAEEMLKDKLVALFEPEIPDEKFMQELAAGSAVKPSLKRDPVEVGLENLQVAPKRTKTFDIPPKMIETLFQRLIESNMIRMGHGGLLSLPDEHLPRPRSPPKFYFDEKLERRITHTVETDEYGNVITPLGFDVLNI